MLIDGLCNPSILNEDIRESFINALNGSQNIYQGLSFKKKHASVYYDAWSNDDNTDPLLSILYSVIKSEQVKLHISKDRDLLAIVSSLADCVTGRSISGFFEAIQGKDFFEELEKQDSLNSLMRRFFDAAIGDDCNRLVIFIDELDRCKPSFAVLLLERIKHFFYDDRITFVFSVNRDQLQHTIRNFYGAGMNGSKYLDKFFDLNIRIPEANRAKFLQNIGFEKSIFIFDSVCFAAIDYCQLELREIAKFFQHIRITVYDEAHERVNMRFGDFSMSFCLIFIVPILIALQISDQNRFHKFINGEDGAPLIDVLSISDIFSETAHWLLNNNETFGTNDALDSRVKVDYRKRLDETYHAIFQQKYADKSSIRIASMAFNASSKGKLLKLISPISKSSNR